MKCSGYALSFKDVFIASSHIFLSQIGVLAKYGAVLPEKRCHENEADALGLTFAAKACFHPKEAVK